MKRIVNISFAAVLVLALAACGSSAKDEKGKTGDLKAKLEELKKQKTNLDEDIRKLEEQILKADPKAAEQVQKLVTVDTVRVQDFSHYIDLQGKISNDGIGYVAPKGGPGVVRAIYVQVGQRVSAGQVVVKLEDAIQRQQLNAARQQVDGVKAQLAQAQSIYDRQQNLWKQNIGSEIQVINAKTAVETLSAQLRAVQAQAAQAAEALSFTNVTAGMSGTIEQVNVRLGETFTGATQAGGQIVIVNNSSIKAEVPVPDNYISKVKRGDKVLIEVPETGKPAYQSTISVVGAAIDEKTRSFATEARLPNDPVLKPNQNAIMKILDYQAKAAVSVPVNIIQNDESGKFIYVAEKAGDKLVARKKVVQVGEAYNGQIEIKSGLAGGDIIITEGYQSVYDGQAIKTGTSK